jgi:phenylpyruvate tautomerase PptA (4-oxalocrotonate tautomerase family)
LFLKLGEAQSLSPENLMTRQTHDDPPPDAKISPDVASQQIRAVTLGRLSPPATAVQIQTFQEQSWWTEGQRVAADWQMTSLLADPWEVALAPAVQRGRSSELAGLVADGGERFVLALAAIAEAELWNAHRQANPPDLQSMDGRVLAAGQEMAQRALAELASYYLLAVGHSVANVTARTLALDTDRHPQLLDALGSWFPVRSEESRDWLSLNRDTARSLRRLAKTARPASQAIVEPVTRLLQSPEWHELSQLRGAHYHRRRPQSAGVMGVPLANPWTFGDGVVLMNLGGSYTDGDNLAMTTTDLVRRLCGVMASVLDELREKVVAVVQEIQAELSQRANTAEPPQWLTTLRAAAEDQAAASHELENDHRPAT